MLGYLLWTGPYSAQRRGMLTTHLEPGPLAECEHHLAAISKLRHSPAAPYRADIVGRLSLLFGQVGRAVALAHELAPGSAAQIHPAIGQAMRLFEAELAHRWTLTELAAAAAPRPVVPGPVVQDQYRPAPDGLPRPAEG